MDQQAEGQTSFVFDHVDVSRTIYQAKGTAWWYADTGLLCYATAEESLKVDGRDSDTRTPRQLMHEAKSTLELTAAR